MLVSHAHKFIFIAASKSASSSTERHLQSACVAPGAVVANATDECVSDFGIVGRRGLRKGPKIATFRMHMAAAQIRQALGPDLFDQYVKIVNVRNPYTRFVSLVLFRIRQGRLAEPTSIDDHIALLEEMSESPEWVLRPMKNYFIDGTPAYDAPIYFENFRDDLAAVANRVGLPLPSDGKIPHEHKSKYPWGARPIADILTQRTVANIRRAGAPIFDHFGYDTDITNAHLIPERVDA